MVKFQGHIVISFRKENGVYVFDPTFKPNSQYHTSKLYHSGVKTYYDHSDIRLWHRRLGHINTDYIRKMEQDSMVTGMPKLSHKNQKFDCRECCLSKSRKRPTHRNTGDMVFIQPGEQLSVYLVVMDTRTIHQEKYALVLVDQFTTYTFSFLLRHKSESVDKITALLKYIQRQTGITV